VGFLLHVSAYLHILGEYQIGGPPGRDPGQKPYVTKPPNYDGPHIPIIVIMTSDSRTYVPHNLTGLLSSEQDPITGVLQYYNSLFKIPTE
jgi:hypothetical protein